MTPTTLVLASNDGTELDAPGSPASWSSLTSCRTAGLQVEVSPDWRTKGEQRVLEDVAAGKAVLGWSGTRAFDPIGVDASGRCTPRSSIGSYPAQKAVVADEVAQDMLAGLEGSGLTGLALLADELRLPGGAEGPLLDPGDFEDLDFGIMPSNAQSAAMTALGARVNGDGGAPVPGTDGLEGLETMWRTYLGNGQQRIVPFVTANAVLWPRTTVIVANSDALDAPRQRRTVKSSPRRRQTPPHWSDEHADDHVADEIAQACAGRRADRHCVARPARRPGQGGPTGVRRAARRAGAGRPARPGRAAGPRQPATRSRSMCPRAAPTGPGTKTGSRSRCSRPRLTVRAEPASCRPAPTATPSPPIRSARRRRHGRRLRGGERGRVDLDPR